MPLWGVADWCARTDCRHLACPRLHGREGVGRLPLVVGLVAVWPLRARSLPAAVLPILGLTTGETEGSGRVVSNAVLSGVQDLSGSVD